MKQYLKIIAFTFVVCLSSGCGLTGDLYIPDNDQAITTIGSK